MKKSGCELCAPYISLCVGGGCGRTEQELDGATLRLALGEHDEKNHACPPRRLSDRFCVL